MINAPCQTSVFHHGLCKTTSMLFIGVELHIINILFKKLVKTKTSYFGIFWNMVVVCTYLRMSFAFASVHNDI